MHNEDENALRIQQLDMIFQERKNSVLAQIIRFIVHYTKLTANNHPEYVPKISKLTSIPLAEVVDLINSAKGFAYSVEATIDRSAFQAQLLEYLSVLGLFPEDQKNSLVTKFDIFSLIAIYYFNKREVENAEPLASSRRTLTTVL